MRRVGHVPAERRAIARGKRHGRQAAIETRGPSNGKPHACCTVDHGDLVLASRAGILIANKWTGAWQDQLYDLTSRMVRC